MDSQPLKSHTPVFFMSSHRISKGALQDSIESDKVTIDIWRAASINGVINHFPARARHVIKFKDWRSAMNYLSKKLGESRR